jgi:DNA-binding PadR family transcriptional regulator
MELSATAKAILGIIAKEPRSGYEIKAFVDKSTRFFWAASYGQIYPELRRLEKEGLIAGTDAPTGGRKRTVYKLTATGRTALRKWHRAEPEVYETRDEALLKLFLADAVDPERSAEIARQRAAHSADIAARLREIEKNAPRANPAAYAVLRSGIAINDFAADWYEQAARDLERGAMPKELAAAGPEGRT